jgi:hypothetical protein
MEPSLYYKIFELIGDDILVKNYFLQNMKKKSYDIYTEFIENKFFVMKKLLSKNNAFNQYNRNDLFDIFEKSQRFIFGIYALKKQLRLKKIQNHDYNKDLNFNSLDDIKENRKVSVVENDVRYTFSLCDIVNIINNSLTFHDKFFSEPNVIKNPYTNLPFSKSSLIKIYSAFKPSPYRMPIIFERFYDCFFDIHDFEKNNEQMIREHNIKCFIKTESTVEKIECIKNMLRYFNKTQPSENKIIIDSNFPKNRMIQIFQKFMHIYLNILSLSSRVRIKNKTQLIIALKRFHIENPIFGRKIIFKNIDKLYEYSNHINNCDRNTFAQTYVPTTDLIDVEKQCYFVGENNNYFSIFAVDSEIKNPPQKILTKKELHLLCLFIHDDKDNDKTMENNYCVPEMKWNELYYNRKNNFELQHVMSDDSGDDSDSDNDIMNFMYSEHTIVDSDDETYVFDPDPDADADPDADESEDDNDISNIELGINMDDDAMDDAAMDVNTVDDAAMDIDTLDDIADNLDEMGNTLDAMDDTLDAMDEDYLQLIIDNAIEDGEI